MAELINKFTSRKFLAALASILIGALNLFGAEGDFVKYGVGAALILIGAVAYIVTEGKLDLASIAALAGSVVEVVSTAEGAASTESFASGETESGDTA